MCIENLLNWTAIYTMRISEEGPDVVRATRPPGVVGMQVNSMGICVRDAASLTGLQQTLLLEVFSRASLAPLLDSGLAD